MKSIILSIVFLYLLCFYMYNNKEKFKQVKSCQFKPWGFSLEGCINRCNSSDYCGDNVVNGCSNDKKEIYGDCNREECTQLCQSCTNPRCMWLQKTKEFDYPKIYDLNKPKNQKIIGYEDDSKINIFFYLKKHKDENKKIKGLFLQYYKLNKPHEGIFTDNINLNNLKSNPDFESGVGISSILSKESKINDTDDDILLTKPYKHVLDNLINGEKYVIVLYAVNAEGISEPSNEIILTPLEQPNIVTS